MLIIFYELTMTELCASIPISFWTVIQVSTCNIANGAKNSPKTPLDGSYAS
jgi:hypothetical protein